MNFTDNSLRAFLASENGKDLVINSLTHDNSGTYECVARNALGSQSISFTVTVKEAAKVLSATEKVEEVGFEDETTTLSCIAQGHPWPNIYWSDEGNILASTENLDLPKLFVGSQNYVVMDARGKVYKFFNPYKSKEKYYTQLMKLEGGSLRFEIIVIDKKFVDVTKLKCKAENIHGMDEKPVNLQQKPLRFVDEKDSDVKKLVQLDDDMELDCDIKGLPKPSIEWTFVG